MPIYEYKCSACRHELEAIQKFADAPLVTCPACGKDALTKLVSAAGFQLKGSGWYQTDFKGSGAKPPSKVDGAKAESGKDAAPTDSSKAAEAKPAPVAPAATTAPAAGT
jgi:putative FmdB family regulatory protein